MAVKDIFKPKDIVKTEKPKSEVAPNSATVGSVFNLNRTQKEGTPTGVLSDRVKAEDQRLGRDWTNASEKQKAYNDQYYRTLDDAKHTQMYLGMEKLRGNYGDSSWRDTYTSQYKAGREYLDKEMADTERQFGKDSIEYLALQRFYDDYENAARWTESDYGKYQASAYSRQLDQNIKEIYGGLMATPEFQTAVEEGRSLLDKRTPEALNFKNFTENASDLQKNLLYYIYATEGGDGLQRFVNSSLGELLTATRASNMYARNIDEDDKLWRGLAIEGQYAGKGLTSIMPDSIRFFAGLAGSDKDDPEDKNLGGGYTISDSTDAYLRSTLGKDLEENGVTTATFNYAAEQGLSALKMLSSTDWVTEMKKDASDYQKQVIGFLYAVSGEEAAKDAWEAIKERDQAIWDAAKKGSNRLGKSVDEILNSLYDQYLGLGGKTPPGFLSGSEGATWAQTLARASMSAAEQIPAWIAGSVVGGVAGAAGMGAKAAAAAGRTAGALTQFPMFGGRAYSEALDKGVEHGKALGYGITEASLEFVTDMLLDGAGAYAGKLTGGLRDKAVAKIANPVLRALTDAGIRSWGEGTQEYVQEALEPVIASIFLDEGKLNEALLSVVDPTNIFDEDRLYAGFLGALTALAMEPGNIAIDTHRNSYYSALGKGFNDIGLDKVADYILNNPVGKEGNTDLYEDAKKTAEIVSKGGKVSDLAAGKMIINFHDAGGNTSWLANPAALTYNKEALTLEDFTAGAVSMLSELEGDVSLAENIARIAMGEDVSAEVFAAIQKDEKAATVLSQLTGELDMSQDNALTRAARASTRGGVSGNKTYETVKAENTTQTVANPAAQSLYAKGVEWGEASQIGDVIEKVMNGEAISEDEAALVSIGNAAVRTVLQESLGVELAEDATIGSVLDALNDAAAQRAKMKADQEIVRQTARQAAEARMPTPIPPANRTQTLTLAGGVEMSHDDFIQRYMEQNGVSQQQAEEAWQQRVLVSGALNGQEETNGTVYGNEERRDDAVAPRGTVQEGGERGDRSGRAADAEGRGVSQTERGTGETNAPRYKGQQITELNSEQRDFVQDAMSDGFTSVTLIKGPLYNVRGVQVNAIAGADGSLIIRWDNPSADPRKVEQHEKIHRWLDAQKNRGKFVMDALWDILDGNEELLTKLYNIYAEKYGKSYEGLSQKEFVERIYEEIFADMYAGLDLYNAGTAQYEEATQMYVLQSDLESDFFGENHQMDYEGMDEFDLSDPFRESTDFSQPPDTRPFPGEEPMHDQLDRFSQSSMAEGTGFELRMNDAGYPFALIDKKTGERVTNVTGDMMKGTPLGDVIQMAVDNGNVSEAEAKKQRQMLADAMNLIVKYNDAAVVWELAGSQMFSAIKANSDKQYNKTIDFSTICKKTMAIVDAMSETMKKLGRGLTRREVEMVYLETGKAGEATPCPVCYVFSRWMGIGNLLDQIGSFQKKYAGKSEKELTSFMADIEAQARAYAEAAAGKKREGFYDKNGNLKIGKVISDMKSKPNSRAASAIKKLNAHQQAIYAIDGLTKLLDTATPEQAAKYRGLIKKLNSSRLTDAQVQALENQMAQADAEVEPLEAYQWLAKTVLMSDMSKVNEDGEALGGWKKNPAFKPVPNDILFDLNRGADFAKDYPLTWAFRTGKGCAMGKAITPYADARVGETIQGVALTDVKMIRTGGLNEFLNGDTAKQKKTLESARKKQRQQNLIGGMRYQSTSDFRYEFGSDYLITFFEMQALGANVQLYTKVIEAVDFLASTGADCNLSVMPLGDGYTIDPATGEKKLAFSNVTGINAEAAIKKSKQYDNVQLILVGINDENIRLALEGTDVTFVIPFHGSGQSVHQVQTLMDLLGEQLDVTQAQDYTSVQSDHVSKNQTAEQKAMWDLRMAIIMGQCEDGLSTEQKALLDKNPHLQKLYDMFYVDESEPAYHNYLAEAQAEHIFPYEYWDKTSTYETADKNGEAFRSYCASMGIVPRFSGINSKGERTGFGDFTGTKGYWKLLIDRSMYENKYDANGEWIGYGKYRPQKTINMSNVKISDLDPATGEAQFQNGEMSKQYDATRSPADRENLDRIVTNAIQRIEAARDKGDIFDKTQVSPAFRKTIMGAQSALREQSSGAERYSLVPVEPVQPTSENWTPSHTVADAKAAFKDFWNVDAEESDDGNPTQRASTVSTYRKIYKILKDQGFNGAILDASSGFGIGTDVGRREFGYDVDDIEPFPSKTKHYERVGDKYEKFDGPTVPRYTDYSTHTKKYDAIISSAVLNVLPQDQRDALVIKMGEMLNPGGRMFITTRGTKGDVDNLARTGENIQLGPSEFIETVYGSYQKGFTNPELKAYLEDALGPGFTVEISNSKNGGKFNNNTSIVVTKDGETQQERYSISPLEYNNRQTTIGGKLKTLNGSPIQRGGTLNGVTYNIGKVIGDRLYIHKDYADSAIEVNPEFGQALERAEKILRETYPDFEYNCINYQPKTGQIQFQEAPDFDTAREPVVGRQVNVEANGDISKIKSFGQIWHHKWQWVGDDYKGFDVADSWNWSKQWLSTLKGPSKGGSLNAWNKQLDEYGLPHDGNAQQERYSVSPTDSDNLGYHAGDLGKAEHLNIQGRSRGTGHFGTGTYFVGEEEKVTKDSYYGKRPQHAVDFTDYNLFRVRNDRDGYRLHDALRIIDGGIKREWIQPALNNEFNIINPTGYYDLAKSKYGEDWAHGDNLLNAMLEYAADNGIEVKTLDEYKADEGNGLDDSDLMYYYEDYVKNTVKEEIDSINSEYREFMDMVFDLHLLPGFTNSKLFSALNAVADYQDATPRYSKSDSYATVFMKALGYDGVDVRGTRLDNTEYGSVIYDVKPETVRYSIAPTDSDNKTNPYPKGSLEDTVLELLRKSGNAEEFQKMLNDLRDKQQANAERSTTAPVIPSKDRATPVNEAQRKIQTEQLQKLIDKYGLLPKGEKPARDVSFPEKTREDRYTRRAARTAAEAKAIPERMTSQIVNDLLTTDLLTYGRITDTAAINAADKKFGELGYKKAVKEWNEKIAPITNTNPTKYDIAFGERVLIEAARNNDAAVAMKTLADLSAMGTQAGQVVQAFRLLKKLGPVGQLYYVQQAVDRLNRQNQGRIAKGKMDPIIINQDLAEAVILAETDEQMQEAMDALIKDIADRLPVNMKDRWDAWRYLSMLFNPRTHIRNIVGNAIFSPVRFAKDMLAAAGEQAFIKDPMERTKSADARVNKRKYSEIRSFAESDFKEMEPQITGTGKMNPLNEIMNRRTIWKSKAFGWLNKLSEFNDKALTKEDVIFLKKAYVDAMTQFIAAKGLSLEELNNGSFESGRILNDARAYAALEAQKATYRDFNRLASALNNAKRAPYIGWLIDGLMPFTKTPMNILRRGIEYSPIGLAKGIYDGLIGVKKGNATAAEAIDHIAAGMTGSMVAILGYFLASMGLARGGGDDDDKKDALESAQGHQKYSLEIGDTSYTIDWAAPVALPFFVGVEIYNQMANGGQVTIWDWANALTMIADPMMSLSMLDGLNSTLASVRYGDKDEALSSIGTNIVTSYLSQGAPTLFGQIARVIDPDRRSTYVDKNSDVPDALQRFVQGIQGKIPGAASQKTAYVDTWGRKDTAQSLLWRGIENFISPGYGNKITETPIDTELMRLAESTGDSSVLPGTVAKYFQVEGERLNLTAKQYEQYKIAVGQKAFSLLGNLMDDVAYISMDDEQKAAAVKKALDAATALGKKEVAPTYKLDNWIARAESEDNLENAVMYQTLKSLNTGLSNYQIISAMDWLTPEDQGKLIMAEHANVSRNMTDPGKKKHSFTLTDEQIAREREIYNSLFWSEYAALLSSQKYLNADVAGRAALISDMQSKLGKSSREALAAELRAAGVVSTPSGGDDEVSTQVTNLYDILNRG